MRIVAMVCSVFLSAGSIHAQPIFVDDSAPAGGDGSSWVSAFRFLQDALVVAAGITEPEIRVAGGVYRPDQSDAVPGGSGDRSAAFQAMPSLTLRGGFAGVGAPDPDLRDVTLFETVLSGDLAGNDGPDFANRGDNSFHVITTSGGSFEPFRFIDGFTVVGGNADGPGDQRRGGGALIESLTRFDRCRFIENSAENGGAIAGWFTDIQAVNCIFDGNRAVENLPGTGEGGALFLIASFDFKITNCLFIGQTARLGGGVVISDAATIFVNCTFYTNHAGLGGAIGIQGPGSFLHLVNSVVWNNTDDAGSGEASQIFTIPVPIMIRESCIEGWTGALPHEGEGNFGDDPLFVDALGPDGTAGTADDDLRIDTGSPCIDEGNDSWFVAGVTDDLAFAPRFVGAAIDVGAYEFQGTVEVPSAFVSPRGEVHVIPHPARAGARVELSADVGWRDGPVTARLFDPSGRLVGTRVWTTDPRWPEQWSASSIGAGVYFLELDGGSSRIIARVVVAN